ncbi:MAG: PQQ-binding-like beta-propeller repeat protein [Saprospiraceae bacterium]|nr:PQQ-binding-like beta-propeller repeat protein [Saprospiraceae bacterium]
MAVHLLALAIMLGSCRKEPLPTMPPPPPLPASALEVLWQHPLSPDTSEVFGSAWHVWQDRVVYTTNFTSPSGQIHCRDAATGELRWKRDDLYTEGWTNRKIVSIADKTIACMSHRVRCIDNQSGQDVWETDVRQFSSQFVGGIPKIYAAGEYVYHAHYTGGPPYMDAMALVRAHHSLGQWDTLFTVLPDNDWHPHLSSASLWINPLGDSVLMAPFTMLGNLSVHGPKSRADLYAFNLRTRQLEWALKDFDANGGDCPIYPPVISGDRLYLNCDKTLFCIDLLAGSVLWSRHFPHLSGSTIRYNSLKEYQNNILLVYGHPDKGAMALSKADGSTVWENPEGGFQVDELTLFEGVLYYTADGTGRLHAIDAATGETIWREHSPNRTSKRDASFYSQNLCIDPVRRLLYVTDKYFVMCIKLPEG